jgi:type I restriction enzyme R subunit
LLSAPTAAIAPVVLLGKAWAASSENAIARANRVYPGKDFGLSVDYNGMLKSLREALAQYALGDDGSGGEEIVAPIEERVQALIEAVEATEAHLRDLGFDPATLVGAKGFVRIKALADVVDAVYSSDEAKRRFEILARQVFIRFKALLMEPTAFAYAERHDNIGAIYKKLTERRDTADVTELLKELHRIVNEAIRTQVASGDQAAGLTFDLSKVDLERLREEFSKKVSHKATAIQDIRDIVEKGSPRCWRATRRVWTTSASTRKSSPTTTARRIARPSRRPFGGSSNW